SRREVRHDAAVLFMQGDLTVKPFADQASRGIEDRGGGFIAGAFQGEDHRRYCRASGLQTPRIRSDISRGVCKPDALRKAGPLIAPPSLVPCRVPSAIAR